MTGVGASRWCRGCRGLELEPEIVLLIVLPPLIYSAKRRNELARVSGLHLRPINPARIRLRDLYPAAAGSQ